MNDWLVVIFLACAAAGLIVLWLKLREERGLPEGDLVYNDLSNGEVEAKPLVSKKYRLAGKPDMIIRHEGELIPVEIKSAPGREKPYRSHVMQLAAYCVLVEENYGIRPSYGILRYRERQFEIPFTEALEEQLFRTMENMREEEFDEAHLPPECDVPAKCVRCGYKDACKGHFSSAT